MTPQKLAGQKKNALISTNKTKAQIANYLHACLFSPCPSTLQKAIQNKFLLMWPGIDKINFYKLVPHAIPKSKGHMSQERKNLRSTKVQLLPKADDIDQFPEKE